ncbi:PAS domain S-box protein [Sulfurimonas sp.]|uniref:PAS domain S-box protein n=1 Tax=Sulfurimonas sp. TaxID=2022749 RepID=UPI003D1203BB
MSKEIVLDEIKAIVSTTDLAGNIKYCNKYFQEVSGYEEIELIGEPHNIIRHPDMPKVIFKLMWERIEQDKDIFAIVKNQTKNGDFYWVTTHFETKYHFLSKKRDGYFALTRAAPRQTINSIIPLYEELLKIEFNEGVQASENYLIDFLVAQNMDYDMYITYIIKNKSFLDGFPKIFH